MRFKALAAMIALALAPAAFAQQVLVPPGASKIGDPGSYGIGYDVGKNIANGGIVAGDIVAEDFLKGMMDALADKEPEVEVQLIKEAMIALTQKIMARKTAVANNFLEENKKKDGVQVTDSGLQYQVIKAGNGASPTRTSSVTVHYEGKLVNGKIFDSSLQRGKPATFEVARVIPGWTEALMRMKVGDKWNLVIPSKLAYGEQGSPPVIGPNETLIFQVELLNVSTPGQP